MRQVKDEGPAYRSLWRVVDGAMRDCILHHPDYFVPARLTDMRRSVVKRVVGAVKGHAAEKAARGRSGENPAA